MYSESWDMMGGGRHRIGLGVKQNLTLNVIFHLVDVQHQTFSMRQIITTARATTKNGGSYKLSSRHSRASKYIYNRNSIFQHADFSP